MRLQLIKFTGVCILIGCAAHVMAQDQSFTDSSKVHLDDIKVNFLSSYYVQEGTHAAVTGGSGTEHLTNFAPSFNIVLPIDSSNTLTLDTGVDFYSSASSDNIDNPYLIADAVSGASASDQRVYATANLKSKRSKQETIGYMLGISNEYDVISLSGGLSYALDAKDKNKGFQIKANYYIDTWKLIYPVEFRNGTKEYLSTNVRNSLNSSLLLYANLTRRLNASLVGDYVLQTGLLSTPFHRVYFRDSEFAAVEQLPSTRTKYPIGVRVNFHATNFMILKSFYRYYADSWGLTAQTFELTVPLKVSRTLRLYPFYRLSIQSQADYFALYAQHLTTDVFFTSDHDLSSFNSTKIGMGLSYSPLYGLSRFQVGGKVIGMFKSIQLRYAHYTRTDGLTANVVTFGLSFQFDR